jgi:MATE family multidrug resistance protein
MFNHTLRETTNLAIVMSMIMAILLALFGDAFINIMTSIPEVVEKSHELLPILVVMPVVSVIAFQMDGVFVGATMGRDMRNAMLISMIVFLPLMYVMEIWFGLIGIWLAFMILLGLRGATLWMRLNHIRVIIE